MVNDGKDVPQIILNRVENTVRKSRKQSPAYAGKNLRIQHWGLPQPSQLKLESSLIFGAQALTLSLLPFVGITELPDGSAGKLQAVRHDPFFNFSLT